MNHRTPTAPTAMTLLELLAALVILSAVASSAAVLLRGIGSAAGRATETRRAAEAVRRWTAENAAHAGDAANPRRGTPDGAGGRDAPEGPWEWTDPEGDRWEVRGARPDETTTPGERGGTAPGVRWSKLTLSKADRAGGTTVIRTWYRAGGFTPPREPPGGPARQPVVGGGER